MGDSGINDKKVKAYKVTRPDISGGSCTFRDWPTVEAEFAGADVGDRITIELVEMTEQQLDDLPEFDGW